MLEIYRWIRMRTLGAVWRTFYFAVLPWFYLAIRRTDSLKLLSVDDRETFWVTREPLPVDRENLKRMG